MPTEIVIQTLAQTSAGIPVAFAMLIASLGNLGPKGVERKNTVFRSSRALRTHCTARKLRKKVASRELANFAMATRPRVNNDPAKSVKGMPDQTAPDTTGL